VPKKTYKILRFDGGVNNNSDARDIAENEFVEMKNFDTLNVGKLVQGGTFHTEDFADYVDVSGNVGNLDVSTAFAHSNSDTDKNSIDKGKGFWIINSDYGELGGNDASTASIIPGGRVYYILENGDEVRICDTSGNDSGDAMNLIELTGVDGLDVIWVDGALRVFKSLHGENVATKNQWRGMIKGVLYGTDGTAGGANQKGHVYNSGGTSADYWYTKNQEITGCFPSIALSQETGKNRVDVGQNLIAGSIRVGKGNHTDVDSVNYKDDGQPAPFAGFASERSGTGTGPNTPPNNFTTGTGMRWGHALGYLAYHNDTGSWSPKGEESYQFWCSTVYIGGQESAPQLFSMYPDAYQANLQHAAQALSLSGNIEDYGPGKSARDDPANGGAYNLNSYIKALAVSTLYFSKNEDDGTDLNHDDIAQNHALFLNPIIKWCGPDFNDTDAIADIKYNFGAVNSSHNGTASEPGNPRIIGLRVYWSGSEDGFSDKWLLYEWNFAKGVKAYGSTGGSGYIPSDFCNMASNFDSSSPHYWYQHVHGRAGGTFGLLFNSPPKFIRYDAYNGHLPEDIVTVDSFKAKCIVNSRVYLGNVQVDGKVYGDMMLKSGYSLDGPNYDKFPFEANQIQVNTNDGEEIVALLEYADRILQFKQNTLYIINVSGAKEFLESTHKYRGIVHTGMACNTDFGIAWVNQYGCFLYDGKQVTSLIENKGLKRINDDNWETHINTNIALAGDTTSTTDFSQVGYFPHNKELIVTSGVHTSAAGYVFNFTTKAWTYHDNLTVDHNAYTPLVTNFANGRLLHASADSNKIYKWEIGTDHVQSQNLSLITRDIDFGEPAVRKKIYKVYISYKGDGDAVTVQYGTNGETDTASDLLPFYRTDSAGVSDNTNSDTTPLVDDTSKEHWINAELVPVASINNIYSFQLHLGGTCAAHNDFEINDITIIYRLKGIR